jgi:long-chain fatty acid transport protein
MPPGAPLPLARCREWMMRRIAIALLETTAVGAVALLEPSGAMASAFALRENSATGMGTAHAGSASAANDPSTIFNNPAGMTRLSGNQVEAVASVIYPSIHFHGTGTAGGGDGGDAGGANVVPAFYAMYDISPDWKAGLAVTTPFGLKTRYNGDWVGRYLGINTSVLALDVNPNLAYKVNDWFSVGGGFSAQYLRADLDNAVPAAAFNATGADARDRVKGDSVAWGYNLGVLVEPLQGTRVGVTYRSRMEHSLDGNELFYGTGALAGLSALNSAARASLTLPDNAVLSVTQAVTSRLTIMSDLQWTHWSTFDALRIEAGVPSVTEFQFKDTMFYSLGAAYKLTDGWTLRAGAAYDESPVRREFRSVRLPDNDEILLSFGATYEFSDAFRVDIGYTHRFLPDAGMNDSVNAVSTAGGVTTSSISGKYDVKADEISIAGRLRF